MTLVYCVLDFFLTSWMMVACMYLFHVFSGLTNVETSVFLFATQKWQCECTVKCRILRVFVVGIMAYGSTPYVGMAPK